MHPNTLVLEESALQPPARNQLFLVLDIDGTLLSESTPVTMSWHLDLLAVRKHLRPHLETFLEFAFTHCGGVGIWTAASSYWLDMFVYAIDPNGCRPWSFKWSGDRVTRKWTYIDPMFSSIRTQFKVKQLRKIWRNQSLRAQGYSLASTIIIENTPSTCLSNYGNAIYVKTYGDENEGEDDTGDDWLLTLVEYLKHLTKILSVEGSVRFSEKRNWYTWTKSQTSSNAA